MTFSFIGLLFLVMVSVGLIAYIIYSTITAFINLLRWIWSNIDG